MTGSTGRVGSDMIDLPVRPVIAPGALARPAWGASVTARVTWGG